MEKPAFDILCKNFVNSTCTDKDKERRNVELCFYLLSDENFISTRALVWNKISAKSKMVKEEFISLLSTLGKMVSYRRDVQRRLIFYGHKIAVNGSHKNNKLKRIHYESATTILTKSLIT